MQRIFFWKSERFKEVHKVALIYIYIHTQYFTNFHTSANVTCRDVVCFIKIVLHLSNFIHILSIKENKLL